MSNKYIFLPEEVEEKHRESKKPGIRFILNGDYRHGTTILWWIMKQSNPEALCLYEPLHPNLFKYLSTMRKGDIFPLHNLPVLDDYFDLPSQVLNEMRKFHKDFTNLFNPNDVFPYLDVLQRFSTSVGYTIYLQPNRMHFVLKYVAERYNCPFTHLVRNPADTFMDYFPRKLTEDEKSLRKIIEGKAPKEVYAGAFYLEPRYKAISSRYGFKCDENDWLSKFVIVWCIGNGEACRQCVKSDKGFITYYEYIVLNPIEEFLKIFILSGIKFKPEYAKHLSAKFINRYPKWLYNGIIQRIKEFGLEEFVKGWFIYGGT